MNNKRKNLENGLSCLAGILFIIGTIAWIIYLGSLIGIGNPIPWERLPLWYRIMLYTILNPVLYLLIARIIYPDDK
ncbi:MAG: hypothetical protein PHS23_07295 [Candidatus Cloacimonetes bacterium]|jgi:hypothetical protein|nr:hypothetical protein [Candidatus Cloacimonadota bacterium]MDD4454307.1 hypothetical protein [Candidatus Methanomethylophilaceae archaeon]